MPLLLRDERHQTPCLQVLAAEPEAKPGAMRRVSSSPRWHISFQRDDQPGHSFELEPNLVYIGDDGYGATVSGYRFDTHMDSFSEDVKAPN
jgi:hypothetical protein